MPAKTSCKDGLKMFEETLNRLRQILEERPEMNANDIDPLTLLEANKDISSLGEYKKVRENAHKAL